MMYKESYWSGAVNPSRKGGDHLKPQDGGAIFSGWSTGQPQIAFYRVAKKKEEARPDSQYKNNSPFGVDRLTTPIDTGQPYGGFRWSPRRAGGLPTLDHLTEVTL